jgi:hypothetical protein
MRVSVNHRDTGFRAFSDLRAQGYRVFVKLNGESQFHCVTADDQCGMIERFRADAGGSLVYDKDRQSFETEVVHGKVEISIHEQLTL